MKLPPRSPFNLRDFAVFVGVVALFMMFGARVGVRGLGCVVVIAALIGWKSARIAYGWQGHEPSGYITGALAKLIFALGGLIGIWMVWEPDLWLAMFGWSDS